MRRREGDSTQRRPGRRSDAQWSLHHPQRRLALGELVPVRLKQRAQGGHVGRVVLVDERRKLGGALVVACGGGRGRDGGQAGGAGGRWAQASRACA